MMTTEGVERVPFRSVEFNHLLDIVRGEFLEMPGLRLTRHQAQRLWSLDAGTCEELLRTLEEMQFLRRTRGGDYMLAGIQ